ncbi:MAG: acyl-CoA dehydrogenase family protein [Caulobacteraceae bacterium]|nr:acyl-CoA dehydrogenase family protein [Caulobacteraceae bacterium]
MSEANIESLEAFRARARAWIRDNLEHGHAEGRGDHEENMRLQRKVYDGGFAGIAVPQQYGGLGLTIEHQRVWAEEIEGYVGPQVMVCLGMMLPTVLDHGTEAVRQRHIPRMLRGEESWIQLLSEPSGGSDMAGALTRATRKGDGYVVNGSKMWSSAANHADYGLCLVRVDWDAPKHQGLAMVALPLKNERVTINPIIPAQGGEAHFFLEYLDDVEIPAEYLLGQEGEGWTVAQRLLFHERNATAGVGYGYGMGGGSSEGSQWRLSLSDLARRSGEDADWSASLVVDDHIEAVVSGQLAGRIGTGMEGGKLEGQWGSLLKLGMGVDSPQNAERSLAVSGADGVVWTGEDEGGEPVLNWLRVRGVSIAGGSNEIQRNIVSERLLGLPREAGEDKNASFNDLMKARRRG